MPSPNNWSLQLGKKRLWERTPLPESPCHQHRLQIQVRLLASPCPFRHGQPSSKGRRLDEGAKLFGYQKKKMLLFGSCFVFILFVLKKKIIKENEKEGNFGWKNPNTQPIVATFSGMWSVVSSTEAPSEDAAPFLNKQWGKKINPSIF